MVLDRTCPLRGCAFAAFGALALACIAAPADGEAVDRNAVWRSIFARPQATPVFPVNAAEVAKAALGADLFRDRRLSADGTHACATCHRPDRGFGDGQALATGRDGRPLTRHTPHLFDVAFGQRFFWDGRAATLEAQAVVPLTAPNEMAADLAEVARRLAADPAMAGRFREAFPDDPAISDRTLIAALVAYERTIASPRNRFDLWVEGDDSALTAQEMSGFRLFTGKAGCVACHGGWRFTDGAMHDIGLPAGTGGAEAAQRFKTPSLREVVHTAPYMHDGSIASLAEVVAHYAGGLVRRPSLDSNVAGDLSLSASERQALVAFLASLSGLDKQDQKP